METCILSRLCWISYIIEIYVFCKGYVSVFTLSSNTSSFSIQESTLFIRQCHTHSSIATLKPLYQLGIQKSDPQSPKSGKINSSKNHRPIRATFWAIKNVKNPKAYKTLAPSPLSTQNPWHPKQMVASLVESYSHHGLNFQLADMYPRSELW